MIERAAQTMAEDDRQIVALVAEADKLIAKPDFNQQDRARAQTILERADLLARHFKRELPRAALRVAEIKAGLDPETHERVFRHYLLRGINQLEPEEKDILFRYQASWAKADVPLSRAQGVGSGAAGGFLAPASFTDQITENLKLFSSVRRVARILETERGTDLPWPTTDDISNVGELLPENAAAAEQDAVFGQVILKSYKYSSKLIRVSLELAQDSSVNLEALLARLFAARIGRITNTHFTTGSGTGQPQGVVTAASLGKTGTTGQTATVIYDDLIDLMHSVDPEYRNSPSCCWQMADSTLKVTRKIKDTANQPILVSASQASEARDMLLGYPVVVNPDMAAMAANAKSILFGDFAQYMIRDSLDFAVLRLSERYAEYGQVGFLAFARTDGRMLNSAAVKYYANSAT